MKHGLFLGVLATSLLLPVPATYGGGQPDLAGDRAPTTPAPGLCSKWAVRDLRGTYAFTATAWQDLSQINPALPGGYAPVTIIGAFAVNGNGGVNGSAFVNAGGLRLTAAFVDSRFGAPRADCTFPISLSMSIAEFGEAVAGPYPYVGVVLSDAPALEIAFMMLGAGPGSHVELDHARRIFLKSN